MPSEARSLRRHRARRASWAVPVVGFATTFLLAAGVSLSHRDVRREAEIAGLAVLAIWPAIGFLLARRRRGTPVALASNGALAAAVVALAAWAFHEHHPPPNEAFAREALVRDATPVPSAVPRAIWIDTDPACGTGPTADVDDCWALALALRSPELEVLGVGTVFGNAPEQDVPSTKERAELARAIVEAAGAEVPVFAGSGRPSRHGVRETAATKALAEELARRRLTLVALGPLTNVAALVQLHPERTPDLERIVLVAGKRPGRLFHPGEHWWFHFSDFNVAQDVEAVGAVLRSGVPLTLVPFELGMQLEISPDELATLRAGDALASKLARASEGWLAFWRSGLMHRTGFSPFDLLAVAQVALPARFACRESRARIGFSVFLAPFGLGRDLEVTDDPDGVPVQYCDRVDRGIEAELLERLRGDAWDGVAEVAAAAAGRGRE